MKISVITLHTIKNYGSVLQTYATQYMLEKMGHQVEFVDYWRDDTKDSNLLKNALALSKNWNRNFLSRLTFKIIKTPSIWRQKRVFNDFLTHHIHLTQKRYFTLRDLIIDLPQADIYCTGSDQMWNSSWNKEILKPFFLEYVPMNKKRIAYAASFGKTVLEEWEKEETRGLLQKYDAISVREHTGIEIIKDLGISKCIQVLDPTLMLRQDEWRHMIAHSKEKHKYILIYQINNNSEFDNYAQIFAQLKGLELIRVGYAFDQIRKPGKLICIPKVEDFLALLRYAEYIITDSFHGTAFSINLRKKFAVIYPSEFNTRLQSILQLTGLENHVVENYQDYTIPDRLIDYNKVDRILEQERHNAKGFLEEALKARKIIF